MKRLIALCALVVLSGSVALQAAPVSKSRALDVAQKFFAAQPATKAAGDVKLIWDGEDIATKATAQPAFYVFGRDGGGFVIVAGDDNVKPILALSDHNEFRVEGMPANVRWWMERMKAYVRSATAQAPDARDQWAAFAATKAGGQITGLVTGAVRHVTPEWNQCDTIQGRLVFNSLCPMDKNQPTRHCITGCVATAISEVLTTMSGIYAEMPLQSLVASVQPYDEWMTDNYVAATGGVPYQLKTKYQWSELRKLMTRDDIDEAIRDGKEKVVKNLDSLMADMGAIMHAMYTVNETSAITAEAPDSLMKYMGFSKSAYYDHAAYYSDSEWREKLKAELKDRPIVYTGQSNAGGHAFVFDGYAKYEGNDVFYVNFGWGGFCNGYFYEYNLDANGNPAFNFSDNCAATFSFYPDPTSKYPIILKISDEGLQYQDNPPEKMGDLLKIFIDGIINRGKTDYEGKIKMVAEDKNGKEKQILFEYSFDWNPLKPSYGTFFDFDETDDLRINYNFSFGDRIVFYYTTNDPGDPDEWTLMECEIDDGGTITALPLMPAPFINTAASYKKGDWFTLKLKNVAHSYSNTSWAITQPDGTMLYKTMRDREIQLTQTGTYRIEALVCYQHFDVAEHVVAYIEVEEKKP